MPMGHPPTVRGFKMHYNKPQRRYPDYTTARSRYVLSPPQAAGEAFRLDYMAFHSLQRC